MSGGADEWSRIARLSDPVRRAIYDLLIGNVELTREQIAEQTGISPSLATHHLTVLTEGGLLEKRPGRSGGHAGRPPATYRRGRAIQLPGRRLVLLADLLTAGRPDQRRVEAAARAEGARCTPPTGTTRSRATRAMQQLGFAPRPRRRALDSGNCPFIARDLAEPETACDVALSLASGIADGLDDVQVERVVGGACCVRLLLPGKQTG
jgi:predicted ArsR family transcriptional regulator